SRPITHEALAERVAELSRTLGDDPARPPHWGGYRLEATRIEVWQGRPSRLHDRLAYARDAEGDWALGRIAPGRLHPYPAHSRRFPGAVLPLGPGPVPHRRHRDHGGTPRYRHPAGPHDQLVQLGLAGPANGAVDADARGGLAGILQGAGPIRHPRALGGPGGPGPAVCQGTAGRALRRAGTGTRAQWHPDAGRQPLRRLVRMPQHAAPRSRRPHDLRRPGGALPPPAAVAADLPRGRLRTDPRQRTSFPQLAGRHHAISFPAGRPRAARDTAMHDYILTLSCPDRMGIVHTVSGWLLKHHGNIVHAQQFGDPDSSRFFLRVHFALPGTEPVESLADDFSSI